MDRKGAHLVGHGALEAVTNALVWLVQTALLEHLILVLDEQLDALNGGSSSLGDCSTANRKSVSQNQTAVAPSTTRPCSMTDVARDVQRHVE